MMKSYELYVFTQPGCPPCDRLKAHVNCLTEAQRASLHYVPLRAPNGERTALAEELEVELTPTLVVTYEGLSCKLDADGDEDCDYTEEPVERFIGANAIIENLDSTIDAYTYANPPE
jgi:thiol-disulfide isomerase/thioredoxin